MRKRFFVLMAVMLVLTPAGFSREATPATHHKKNAEEPNLIPAIKPVVATYDVYVGGIHLLTADILFEETTHSYHARMNGKTYGLWYHVYPWDAELNAEGKIKGDHFIPADYTTHDVWGKKTKTMNMHFTAKDITTTYDPPEQEDKDKTLTPEQKVGALDPVTALLQMLAHLAIAQDCNVSVPVFDGKRRFDVIANDTGSEYIDEDDYGVYTGETRTCDARFKAVAGEWSEKLKARFWKKGANGEDREPFHVWLAQIAPNEPQLAVRIETGSAWGDIIMHLTRWRPATADDGLSKNPR